MTLSFTTKPLSALNAIAKAMLALGLMASVPMASTAFALTEEQAQKKIMEMREQKPGVNYIDYNQFVSEKGKSVIIDVRSKPEYDLYHIESAVHVSAEASEFTDRLSKAVRNNRDAKIIFYCNGFSCIKSTDAFLSAQKQDFSNIAVYLGGVAEIEEKAPDLLRMADGSNFDARKMVSREKFNEKELDPIDFHKKVN